MQQRVAPVLAGLPSRIMAMRGEQKKPPVACGLRMKAGPPGALERQLSES